MRTLGLEHAPLLAALQRVLASEPNPINQQIAIELLMAGHAARMGRDRSSFVIDSMAKHAKQIIEEVDR